MVDLSCIILNLNFDKVLQKLKSPNNNEISNVYYLNNSNVMVQCPRVVQFMVRYSLDTYPHAASCSSRADSSIDSGLGNAVLH